MTTWVAFLRAVNVGGTGKLPMTELRKLCEQLGFAKVRTYIQSGNVLFETDTPRAELEESIETLLAERLGCPVPVVVRSHRQLADVVASAPEGFGADRDTYLADVVFLKAPLTSAQAIGTFRAATRW